MGFWDFHDTRYSEARTRAILSIAALVIVGAGLTALLLYGERKARLFPGSPTPIVSPGAPAPPPPAMNTPRTAGAAPARFSEFQPKPFDLAMKAIEEKKLASAEEYLKESLNRGERLEESFSFLGVILKENQKYAEAVEIFTKGIRDSPQASRYFNRAECYDFLGEESKAKADYDVAVEKSPRNPLFSNKRYLFMIRHGRQEDVAQTVQFQFGLGVTQNNDTWIMAAAALTLREGNTKVAADILQQASQLLSRQDFAYILQDPLFQEYRNDLQIRPFLNRKP